MCFRRRIEFAEDKNEDKMEKYVQRVNELIAPKMNVEKTGMEIQNIYVLQKAYEIIFENKTLTLVKGPYHYFEKIDNK